MEKLLNVKQVQEILQTGRNYTYELIKQGKIKSVNLRGIKVRQSDLDEFIKSLETNQIA